MITAKEITNYYLYGTIDKPSDLEAETMIRDPKAVTTVGVNTIEYMSSGPGRFANPVLFELIDKFFHPDSYPESAGLAPKTYEKGELREAFGIEFAGLKLQQWQFDDGKDDLHRARVYLEYHRIPDRSTRQIRHRCER